MATKAQEDFERRMVTAALSKLGIKPVGEPEKQKEPAPDFLLVMEGGRRIGIEVTQARNQHIASGRGTLKRLCDRVESELERSSTLVWVDVGFTEGEAADLNKLPAVLNEAAAGLVGLARDLSASERAAGDLVYLERDDLEAAGVRMIDHAGMWKSDKSLCTWSVRAGQGERRLLVDAIAAKNPRVLTYRTSGDYDEVWLLVAGSTGHGGQLDTMDGAGVFVSAFDRTVFYETFNGTCAFLKTEPPPS